jgi:lipopolysaccharide transport system permease protein
LIVVQRRDGWRRLALEDVWRFRELLFFLVLRDLKVRYKQTALGAAWAILQPLVMMLLLSLFFGRLGQVPSDGVPYPIFACSALLPWQLFASSTAEASNSLIVNKQLLTKVYFPRLLLPLSAVTTSLFDFCIASSLLGATLVYYRHTPTPAILAVPFLTMATCSVSFGVGCFLSALNARYRDIRYALPFLLHCWLFLTPIAYPVTIVPEIWRPVYALNPMVGVIEGFRWAVLGASPSMGGWIVVSCATALITLTGGMFYFKRVEASFAEIV